MWISLLHIRLIKQFGKESVTLSLRSEPSSAWEQVNGPGEVGHGRLDLVHERGEDGA